MRHNFMRRKKKAQQRLSPWLSALPVAIFLTSCDSIIATGVRFSSPLPELSKIAAFSIIWLIPAFLIGIFVSIDHDEMTTGYGSDGIVFLPTGKTVPGDPQSANFLANLWLVAYPIGYFYYTHLDKLALTLTTFPNLEWILLRIIFPALSLALIAWVILAIWEFSDSFFIFRWLILGWKILVSLATINLIGWLLALFVPWLLNLVIDLASWLFRR
jgi:hypothetical protein